MIGRPYQQVIPAGTGGAGIPTQLAFSVQPAGAVSGAAFTTQPQVQVLDGFGVVCPSSNATITLAINTGSGTIQNVVAMAVAGVATWSSAQVTGTGNFTLVASSGTLTTAISGSFAVGAAVGAATQLVFSVQPASAGGAVDGVVFSRQPTVSVLDASGALVTTSTATITLAVNSGSGVMGGTVTINAGGGNAAYTNIRINGSGTDTLIATSPGLTSTISASFLVSPATSGQTLDLDPARGVTNAGFAGNRIPQFIVTAAWRTNFNAAVTANDPWALSVRASANATGTGSQRYGDAGQHCGVLYQATGTASYATAGIAALTAALAYDIKANSDTNSSREYLTTYIILYDWFYAAMSGAQRTALMARLVDWTQYVSNINCSSPYSGGTRLSDSDVCISHYFALACMDCLTVPENTQQGTFLQQTTGSQSPTIFFGGINATAADWTSVRNVVKFFATVNANGGEWFESSEYNAGTSQLWAHGYAAVTSTLLTDHFPEYTALLPLAAKWFIHSLTPGPAFTNKFQYGDDEQGGEFPNYREFPTYETCGTMAGLLTLAGHPDAPLIGKFVSDLQGTSPVGTTNTGLITRSAFGSYNPLAAKAADYSRLGTDISSYFGRRVVTLDPKTRVSFFTPQPCGVDHYVIHYAHAQAWVTNEFALYNPISYLAGAQTNCINGVLLCGLSSMFAQTVLRDEGTVSGGAVTRTWSTQGQFYAQPYYNPPPTFVQKAECRMTAFLDNGWLVIVFRDDLNVQDPSTLANYARYRAGDAAIMNAALARNERVARIFHHPVAATDIAGGYQWTTGGGRTARVYATLGVATTVHYDETASESVVFNAVGTVIGAQRKFQTRTLPPVQDVNVLLHVFMVEQVPGATPAPVISGASSAGVTVGNHIVTYGANSTNVSSLNPLAPGYAARTMTIADPTNGGAPLTVQYQIYIPVGYTTATTWPVVLCLNGSGQDGTDNQAQLTAGVPQHLSTVNNRAILVLPQFPILAGTSNSVIDLTELIAMTALNQTLAEVRANVKKVTLTGYSTGGVRGWGVLTRNAATFAAMVTTSGRNNPVVTSRNAVTSQSASDATLASSFATLPTMIVHGSADATIAVTYDEGTAAAFGMATVGAVGAAPPRQQYVEYAGLGQQPAWDTAYGDTNLWTWLFAQAQP